MPVLLDGLDPAQQEAVAWDGEPLLVVGAPGTGKTHALARRFAWLVDERGVAPEAILTLTMGGGAETLRERIERALSRAHGELALGTPTELAVRLLRAHAVAAGLDPFFLAASTADRLALLLGHVDELRLRRHDLAASPARLLAGFVARIDGLKAEGIGPEEVANRAPSGDEAEREFAAVYAAHDRLLARAGALDAGELVLRAGRLIEERPAAAAGFEHVLVDDLDQASAGVIDLIGALTTGGRRLWATAAEGPSPGVRLTHSHRSPARLVKAAAAAAAAPEPEPDAAAGGELELWCAANERAQAQAVAADVERAAARHGGEVAVLVPSLARDGQAVAAALAERGIAHGLLGGAGLYERAEIRDLLAWLRLLVDPGDAAAVVRALARPPIELRAADLARCTQIARRRRLDMVAALAAATESPQIPPEARERVLRFLKLYRAAARTLDTLRPDIFVHRLIERLGLRRQQLFAAQADVVDRLLALARFGELAAAHARRDPQASARDFARHATSVGQAGLEIEAAGVDDPIAAGAVIVAALERARELEVDDLYVVGLDATALPDGQSQALRAAILRARRRVVLAYAARAEGGGRAPAPAAERVRAALELDWSDRDEELFGPAESLHAAYRSLREELLAGVAQTGGRLSELRFDTDLDVSHAVVRHLELLKLAALIERDPTQPVADALMAVNARLRQAVTAEQREILETSGLDEWLLDAERDERRRAQLRAAREEPSLEAFLPKRGDGLLLSASDVEVYRTCPLRYKFARVFRIPQEPTINQRFGIVVHQVLERFHAAADGQPAGGLSSLLGLLNAAWRRGGFGDTDRERQLHDKATSALARYHSRFEADDAQPLWFERSFRFRLGPHVLRGRVDRVDRLPDGGYELIDYKTGRPKTAAQLADDVQLSLYAVGAREAWALDAGTQSYYYVLDDEKVAVPTATDPGWIEDAVHEVADGILSQGFEPTPSYAACSTCDYRLICPAAER